MRSKNGEEEEEQQGRREGGCNGSLSLPRETLRQKDKEIGGGKKREFRRGWKDAGKKWDVAEEGRKLRWQVVERNVRGRGNVRREASSKAVSFYDLKL